MMGDKENHSLVARTKALDDNDIAARLASKSASLDPTNLTCTAIGGGGAIETVQAHPSLQSGENASGRPVLEASDVALLRVLFVRFHLRGSVGPDVHAQAAPLPIALTVGLKPNIKF